MRARPVPVYLVDHHYGAQAARQGLLGDEAGLRHGPVHGVHQQQHGIGHGQDALHLAAEVGVAGGVYDIDTVAVPFQGRILGQYGNAALAFQVIGIHDPFRGVLARGQGAGLAQQLVDQGGLAVVYVGDDRDVADLL